MKTEVKPTKPTTVITFAVDRDLRDQLAQLARARDLTISQIMRRAARDVLQKEKAR